MKKLYYLSTCSTCARIIKELPLTPSIRLHDLKTTPLSLSDLEYLFSIVGSYEALFSKKAQLYKSGNLKSKNLTEIDFKNLILEHYTFLKRPILVVENQLYIGNAAITIQQAQKALHEQSQ